MARPVLEIADIFRDHGAAWRKANAGHVSLGQLKVMSAIESCRTAALGGHVMRCEDCSHTAIAYNSCRNRHCPKCQGSQALAWMEERKAELLPVPYLRRLMLEMLVAANDADRLQFFGDHAHLADKAASTRLRSRPISRRCIGPSGLSIASGRSLGRWEGSECGK